MSRIGIGGTLFAGASGGVRGEIVPESGIITWQSIQSGAILSGSLVIGQIDRIHIASGHYQPQWWSSSGVPGTLGSGVVYQSGVARCHVCDKMVGNWVQPPVPCVVAHSYTFCYECAGFNPDRLRFFRTMDLLRHAVSHDLDPTTVPDYALADWYEDKGLPLIADYIRSSTNDQPVSSSR